MHVGVIIPCYNGLKWLTNCVESVLRQDGLEIELYLVDDGSTDGSIKLCKEFVARNNNVQLIELINGGVSKARNVGFQRAFRTCESVLFLDQDDFLAPQALQSLVNLLIESGAQAVHGNVAMVDSLGTEIDSKSDWSLLHSNRLAPSDREETSLEMLAYRSFVSPGCVLIRTDELAIVGAFAEGQKYGEDLDLFYRLSQRSPIKRLNSTVLYYRVHESNTTKLFELGFQRRMRLWTDVKCLVRIAINGDRLRTVKYSIMEKWSDHISTSGSAISLSGAKTRFVYNSAKALLRVFCRIIGAFDSSNKS